ncbi:MAG: EamA family transporter [bacterium]|nr:EamA family transporter [bacterium]
MPILYLCLALLSSLTIALLLRVWEHKKCNRVVIIASNYIMAGTLSYALSKKAPTEPGVYLFGAILGILFFVSFIVFSKAIKSEGIAGAVTMARISLAIPVVLSIIFWGEKPFITDIVGLLLIVLIILAWEGKIGKLSPLLLALFLFFGCNDALMKYFTYKYPAADIGFFLIIVFYSALVWSWGYLLVTRRKVKAGDVGRGLLLGLPNFFSTLFVLKALETIPAYITFPFINICMIMLSALLGYLFFKEKLQKKKVFLIFLGIIAVLFLTT